MKTVIWVLVSPMLQAIAFLTALVCVIVGTILGRLTPQRLRAMPDGSVASPLIKNEAIGSKQGPQQPVSGAEHKTEDFDAWHRQNCPIRVAREALYERLFRLQSSV